jgi:hypothetical protein
MSTREKVPSFESRGLRLFEREVERGWDMCRAVWRAVVTWARVMFFPSRGLGGGCVNVYSGV